MKSSIVKLLILMPLLLGASILFSQRENYFWIYGYKLFQPTADTMWGRCELRFNDSTLTLKKFNNIINTFDYTNASIADTNGALLFYTNGISIYNRYHQIMPNGDSLNPGQLAIDNRRVGYTLPSGALILPWPEKPNLYLLFHHAINKSGHKRYALNLFTSLIDINQDNGNGAVIYKNKSVLSDSLSLGGITACRHANGRDWWLLAPYFTGKKVYALLLDPSGIHVDHEQQIPFSFSDSHDDQAVFSPDGKNYAFFQRNNYYHREYFKAGFDRCNGRLHTMQYDSISGFDFAGCAFSPNSQFLYLSTGYELYQLDMTDLFPFKSKIRVDSVDGFISSPPNFASWFEFMQLGPDGKIYITNGRGTQHLSTIEYPDRKGKTCGVRQHNIQIVHNSTYPNFPNFRLGAEINTVCDSINKPKKPIAQFSYSIDSGSKVLLQFTDLSLHNPDTYFWDFGDFSTSTEKDPSHTFLRKGFVEVCLKVSNNAGADSTCQIINIGSVTTKNNFDVEEPLVYPNPSSGLIHVRCNEDIKNLQIFNIQGIKLQYQTLNCENKQIDLDLPKGMYYLKFISSLKSYKEIKFIVE